SRNLTPIVLYGCGTLGPRAQGGRAARRFQPLARRERITQARAGACHGTEPRTCGENRGGYLAHRFAAAAVARIHELMDDRPVTLDVSILGRDYRVACKESERDALVEAGQVFERRV